jgi:Matrixin
MKPTRIGSPGQPRLIGRYPAPRLHLAGATPRRIPPTRWSATVPRPSYGIDYTFTRTSGRIPVRWPGNARITVRLAAPAPKDAPAVLHEVVIELRELTGLHLDVGDPIESAAGLGVPDPGEIRVGYVPLDGPLPAGIPPTFSAHTLGLGIAIRAEGATDYCAGLALVNSRRWIGSARDGIAVLRHELGHALGLGHANRASSLMHHETGPTTWTLGDKAGLRIAGQAPGPNGAGPGPSIRLQQLHPTLEASRP